MKRERRREPAGLQGGVSDGRRIRLVDDDRLPVVVGTDLMFCWHRSPPGTLLRELQLKKCGGAARKEGSRLPPCSLVGEKGCTLACRGYDGTESFRLDCP